MGHDPTRGGTGFIAAVGFLTRVPVAASQSGVLGAAWFPVVGGLIGLAGAAIYWLADLVLPPLVSAAIAVTGMTALTGALHEDGLADYADALGSGAEGSLALEVMDDPRVGTFGVIALIISFTWRIAALSALGPSAAVAGLVLAHTVARSGAVVLAGALPPARSSGLGRSMTEESSSGGQLVAAVGGLALSAVASGIWALFAGLVAATVVGVLRRSAARLIGGVTGDVLGACEQLIEVLVLTLAVIATRIDVPVWEGLL